MTTDPRTDEEYQGDALASIQWRKEAPENAPTWRTLPPTDKQVNYLLSRGRCIPRTRGEASQMIGEQIQHEFRCTRRRARHYAYNPNRRGCW